MQPVRHNGRVSGEVKIVEAAGAVLYRRNTDFQGWMKFSDDGRQTSAASRLADFDTLEVCIVHRPKYDDWSWPKRQAGAQRDPPPCGGTRGQRRDRSAGRTRTVPRRNRIPACRGRQENPPFQGIEPSTRSTFSSGWQGRSTPRTPCGGPTRSAPCIALTWRDRQRHVGERAARAAYAHPFDRPRYSRVVRRPCGGRRAGRRHAAAGASRQGRAPQAVDGYRRQASHHAARSVDGVFARP